METKVAPCPLGAECETIKEGIKYVCPWYVMIRGKNPQSEEEIDEWRCAIAWMPMLTIENSQQQRQTGAAVESFRNETVKQNDKLLSVVSGTKPELKNNIPLISIKETL